MAELTDRTTIVVGASRGLGRGIATAFAEAGAPVVAVARNAAALTELVNGTGAIEPEVADAADPTVASMLIGRYDPETALYGQLHPFGRRARLGSRKAVGRRLTL